MTGTPQVSWGLEECRPRRRGRRTEVNCKRLLLLLRVDASRSVLKLSVRVEAEMKGSVNVEVVETQLRRRWGKGCERC